MDTYIQKHFAGALAYKWVFYFNISSDALCVWGVCEVCEVCVRCVCDVCEVCEFFVFGSLRPLVQYSDWRINNWSSPDCFVVSVLSEYLLLNDA